MKLVGNKKAIRSSEFHHKKERERKIRLTLVTLAVLVVIVGPIMLLRMKSVLISTIVVSGNEVTASSDIESIVTNDLAGDYLWVIPKSNALLYSEDKIKADILAAIPRIETVNVSLSSLHNLNVVVSERTPSALYCTNVSDITNPTGCYFLDASGYIFSAAPAFSGGVYMIYSSNPALDNPLRQQFMPASQFQNLANFLGTLSHIPVVPKVFVAKTDEDDLLLPSGTVIMWKPTQDLDTIYSNLSAFLTDPSLTKNTPSSFLYIDLRFDDKVFYKYK